MIQTLETVQYFFEGFDIVVTENATWFDGSLTTLSGTTSTKTAITDSCALTMQKADWAHGSDDHENVGYLGDGETKLIREAAAPDAILTCCIHK